MITSPRGYPMWTGVFLPYGQEWSPQITMNHYKFTGKERDLENGAPGNGLDYFGARYYSSTMGRWMTPDWAKIPEPVPFADLIDPQSLNLYGYVRNNPISRSDPDGHYEVRASGCGGHNQAKCQKKYDKRVANFEKQRQKDLHSKDPRVRAAATAYGNPGKKNGVHVGFADLGPGIKGSVDPLNSGKGRLIDIEVTINTNLSGKSLRETISHEGSHVQDNINFLTSYDFNSGHYSPGQNFTGEQTEFRAYQVGAGVTHEHGFGPNDTQRILDYIRANYAPNYLNTNYFPNNANFPQ